jgi:hypothetical protein
MGSRTCAALAVATGAVLLSNSRHAGCQSAVTDNFHGHPFLILDQFLVRDIEHGARKRCLRVLHQTIIGDVVLGQVVEIVRKRVARAEQRAVHRQAVVDRVPPDVDHRGAG